jgi:cobalamin synthase
MNYFKSFYENRKLMACALMVLAVLLFIFASLTNAIVLRVFLIIFMCACFAATPVAKKLLRRFDGSTGAFALQLIAVVAGLLLCTAALASQSYNPFIYFRF